MKYRLISIDRPGLGYSDFGNTLNLQKQSALISLLLHSLSNGKPVHLVGHSLGGPLIVKIAADHPELVSSLVILAGAVDPSLEKKEYWRPVLTYTPLRWLVPSAMRYSNEELWYLKKDLKKLVDDFAKVTCPVLIFHGDKDNLVPIANVEYAKKMLTHAASVNTTIFSGANHFIVWTKYGEIKDALLRLGNN
jgi:pimeloyl-ACP methyl ester carboxylesterase